MKRSLIPSAFALAAILSLSGCVGLSVGGGSKTQTQSATLGQQLIDLQRARQIGAISEGEYQIQREKLLQRR